MTEDEIRQWLSEHRHLSRRRKLAFVKANMDFDIEAVATKLRDAALDLAVRDGLLIKTGEGKVRATGEIAPVDAVGLARIVVQYWRQKRGWLERLAKSGRPLERARAKSELAEIFEEE